MGGVHFVVSVGADQHHVLQVLPAQKIFEQIERCCIEPLQIVEEQRKRVLRPREYGDESPEYQLESALRIQWRKDRNRRLFSDDEFQFRDKIDDKPRVWPQRLAKGLAPDAQLLFLLAEKRADKAAEGLRERGIRDVAFVLVELTRGKKAAGRYEHLVQLIDDRGLADTGISGDQHQLWYTGLDDAIEAGKQRGDLTISSVQLFGDEQPVRRVQQAERKVIDTAARFPFRQAASQIALDTAGGLVTILGSLGEQLHNDRRDGRWDT